MAHMGSKLKKHLGEVLNVIESWRTPSGESTFEGTLVRPTRVIICGSGIIIRIKFRDQL